MILRQIKSRRIFSKVFFLLFYKYPNWREFWLLVGRKAKSKVVMGRKLSILKIRTEALPMLITDATLLKQCTSHLMHTFKANLLQECNWTWTWRWNALHYIMTLHLWYMMLQQNPIAEHILIPFLPWNLGGWPFYKHLDKNWILLLSAQTKSCSSDYFWKKANTLLNCSWN